MKRRALWFAAFASLLGVVPAACHEAPPSTPAVSPHEVAARGAAAPVATFASSDIAAPDAPAAPTDAPATEAAPSPARLDWFDAVIVARPRTQGKGPGMAPDPCARGRHTPECLRAGLVDPPDMRAAVRAGLELEMRAGLTPKPGLDAAQLSSARQAITAVERQAFLCAITHVADSMLVSIELATAGGDDGVHAQITGAEAAPEFARCLRPSLESGARFAPDGVARRLRFELALRAVWH